MKFILSGKNKEKKPDGHDDFARNFVKCYVSKNLMKKDPDKITSPEKNITEEIKRLIVNTGVEITPQETSMLIKEEFKKFKLKIFNLMIFS